jgi:hypothetical protein
MDALTFDHVLRLHAWCSLAVGALLVLTPHALFGRLTGEPYSHVAHELARCYGCLTLAQAWFARRTLTIADGRVRRMLAEAFAVCFALTGIALLRAAYEAPSSHGAAGVLAGAASLGLAALYAYFRFVRKLKSFELPGSLSDGHAL